MVLMPLPADLASLSPPILSCLLPQWPPKGGCLSPFCCCDKMPETKSFRKNRGALSHVSGDWEVHAAGAVFGVWGGPSC